jgi:hypothetical protein
MHWTKEDRANKSQTINLAIKTQALNGWVFCKKVERVCLILARVKYLCDYGIDNCNPVCLCVSSWGIRSHDPEFFVSSAGSHVASWKTIELPSSLAASCLTLHNCNVSVTRVAKRLQVPTMGPRDILHQAKGGSSCSSPLRSDGSREDQAGEAGPLGE